MAEIQTFKINSQQTLNVRQMHNLKLFRPKHFEFKKYLRFRKRK